MPEIKLIARAYVISRDFLSIYSDQKRCQKNGDI